MYSFPSSGPLFWSVVGAGLDARKFVCILFGMSSSLSPRLFRRFGAIPAGFPSPAQGYEDEPLDLHELLVPRPAATFFYRVRGSDLEGEGLPHDAILVVDRSVTPRPGDLVLADREGERLVCRLPRGSSAGLVVWGAVTAAVVRY
jgi:DNA polymerase V